MYKIPTIFQRDEQDRSVVIAAWDERIDPRLIRDAIPTVKMDGTNVRVWIKDGKCFFAEKRRNPSREQKEVARRLGLPDPGPQYIAAPRKDKENKYLYEAIENTDVSSMEQGAYSAELIGPKVQGNPHGKTEHTLYFFGVAPDSYTVSALRDLSFITPEETYRRLALFFSAVVLEGVVWWFEGVPIGKIKRKDFGYQWPSGG